MLSLKLNVTPLFYCYIYKNVFMERDTTTKKKQESIKEQKPEVFHSSCETKTNNQEKLSLTEGKAHAYQLIEAWAKGQ